MMRLHVSLRGIGLASEVLVRHRGSDDERVHTVATRGDADPSFPALRDAIRRRYVDANRTGASNTHFSLPLDGADLARKPLVASSSVVHLHWVASLATPSDAAALFAAKPVVWTLHDFGPLTGGCHYAGPCRGYARGCEACPQLVRDPLGVTAAVLRDKTTLWRDGRPTFVAPSRFIAGIARRSAAADRAGASIVHIPFGIDVGTFRPIEKAEARRALGLPANGTFVLCGADYTAEKRKGVDAIGRIARLAEAAGGPALPAFSLLTVGDPKIELPEWNEGPVAHLGRVAGDRMPLVYAAADIFLHPSTEDNAPLMLLEAAACGLPAVAYDVGGVAEIVQGGSGSLVPAGDERAMAAELAALLDDPQRRLRTGAAARTRIEEGFDARLCARRHADLYADVSVKKKPPRRARRPQSSAFAELMPRLIDFCLSSEAAAAAAAPGADATAELYAILEDRNRALERQQAEIEALYAVSEERRLLVERLHAAAAASERQSHEREAETAALLRELVALQAAADERERLVADLGALVAQNGVRDELDMLYRVAEERRDLVERLHAEAAESARQLREMRIELTATYAIAEERKALLERNEEPAAAS